MSRIVVIADRVIARRVRKMLVEEPGIESFGVLLAEHVFVDHVLMIIRVVVGVEG